MPSVKLLNIFALSTFAILLCSLAPSQTLALSIKPDHLARELPNHHGIAKKKRANKRCKSKPSSSPGPTSSPPKDTPTSTSKVDTPANTPKVNLSPSSTSSPATVQTPTTPSGSGKLAVAWAMGEDSRFTMIISTHRVAMVNLWTAMIPSIVQKSGIPTSIMLWSDGQDRINDWTKYAKPGYASHAMGFNEVNEPRQANMDVPRAVTAWRKYIMPLASQGYTLGSPSTSSNPNGYAWMQDFLKQCGNDCHVDEMLIHWYDVKFEDLKAYTEKWLGFGLPVRVTEFACQNFNGGAQPTMDEIWSFTDQAIKYFEGNSNVKSYAPFGFMDGMDNVDPNNRLFKTGGLTDLGWKYVNGY